MAHASPDFPEFTLRRITLDSAHTTADLRTSACPRIAICISGLALARAHPAESCVNLIASERSLSAGDVVICAAQARLNFELTEKGGDCLLFVASCHDCYQQA